MADTVAQRLARLQALQPVAPADEPTAAPAPGPDDRLSRLQSLQPSTNEQEVGKVYTPEQYVQGAVAGAKLAKRTLLPTKEQLPEFIGATGLGIAATAAGAPALLAAGTVGSGAVLGEIGHQGWQAVTGNNPPGSIKESLKRQGGAFLRGAGAEVGGRIIGKIFHPFSGSATTAIKNQMAAAGRAGVEAPLSNITESPVVQSLERFAEFSPFGAKITARRQQAVQQLERFTEKITDGIGPDTPSEVIPQLVESKINAAQQAFRKAKDAAYEPINQILGDRPVDTSGTIATIKEVLKHKAGGKEGQSLMMDWLERLSPKAGAPGYQEGEQAVFNTLKAVRSEVGSRGGHGDPGMTGLKAQLDKIGAAATQDMDRAAEKYGLKDALTRAEEVYSTGIKKLQDATLRAAKKKAESDPEALHKIFIRKNNPTQIQFAKQVLGEDGFNLIRKQWFDDLVANSKITDGETIISPGRLANNLRKMGSTLEAIASDSPKLAQQLMDLADVSKMLTRGAKITHGSPTGWIMNAVKSVRGLLAAPLVRTKLGMEYLTTGFPTMANVATRATQPAIQDVEQKVAE